MGCVCSYQLVYGPFFENDYRIFRCLEKLQFSNNFESVARIN